MHIVLMVAVLGLGATAEGPALCSVRELRVSPGYIWRAERITDFVDSADVIVRARAVARDSMLGGPLDSPRWFPAVRLEVLEALRDSTHLSIVAYGDVVDRDDFNPLSVPYQMVRRAGQHGDCYASEYRLGAEYLLLLKRDARGLTPYWKPLAPLNEQITGTDDPWVQWVRKRVFSRAAR